MQVFAQRARGELVAAGANPRNRPIDPGEQLTPQEQQIARLARDGLTNMQIGAQLFLSPRTIEWHLHKMFGKLRIDSRSRLHAALARQERDAAPYTDGVGPASPARHPIAPVIPGPSHGRSWTVVTVCTDVRHPSAGVRGPNQRA